MIILVLVCQRLTSLQRKLDLILCVYSFYISTFFLLLLLLYLQRRHYVDHKSPLIHTYSFGSLSPSINLPFLLTFHPNLMFFLFCIQGQSFSGCSYTSCPISSGSLQTYTYPFHTFPSLPFTALTLNLTTSLTGPSIFCAIVPVQWKNATSSDLGGGADTGAGDGGGGDLTGGFWKGGGGLENMKQAMIKANLKSKRDDDKANDGNVNRQNQRDGEDGEDDDVWQKPTEEKKHAINRRASSPSPKFVVVERRRGRGGGDEKRERRSQRRGTIGSGNGRIQGGDDRKGSSTRSRSGRLLAGLKPKW